MIKHFILNFTVVVLNKTSIDHVLHSSITRSSTMPPLPSTTMIKIIIHTTCLCHFVEGSTRDGAHSRLSLNRERAGHYTLAVVIDRLSLLCRPQNKYSRECCQPESLSDRVRYLISFPRSHISPYYMLDCFRNCCCESGFIGKCKKCDSLSAAAHCLIISLVFYRENPEFGKSFHRNNCSINHLFQKK